MNLLQHLIVAEQCAPDSRVLDVCCGRGVALPLLYRYAPKIARYVGLDISVDNLDEARERIEALRARYGDPFPVDLVECDVAQPWPALPSFDIALYTSALEHLPFELGAQSLRNTAAALAPGGVLYLSTPRSRRPPPRPLQYRVHVYEWSRDEVEQGFGETGLVIENVLGLLPPAPGRPGDRAHGPLRGHRSHLVPRPGRTRAQGAAGRGLRRRRSRGRHGTALRLQEAIMTMSITTPILCHAAVGEHRRYQRRREDERGPFGRRHARCARSATG
ncbi:class I SAM-dependent methyltransferase [Kibdelosporangium philippinense]|uniref:class I SAM-dependent methyltransferase n=1 Tax=Kibdelosporangium philippinense TaxID=211113 RepID=UPI0036093A1B